MQTPLVSTAIPVTRLTARHANRRILGLATRAFTLMEILVVLAIAGMIIGLAVANLDVLFGSAKEKTAKMHIKQLKTPLFNYRSDMGDYPSTAEGLRALLVAPADKAARWRGPYLENGQEDIIDPWLEPYQYRYPGSRNKTGYDLWSKGPDKQDGTTDDIGNWTSDDSAANSGYPGIPAQ